MKKSINTFLNKVKTLLVDVYGENADYVYVDEEEDLVQYTGFGHKSEGGIRCETQVPMYDIMTADDFPQCPDGYFVEAINSWSFAVYKV